MSISTLVVCETRLTNDEKVQRETALAVALAPGAPCAPRLVGTWMDHLHFYTCGTNPRIAVSLSNDGRSWFAPANPPSSPSGCVPPSAVRRWFNDCYFVGSCPTSADCQTRLPNDCPTEIDDICDWHQADNDVATDGAGNIHVASLSFPDGNPANRAVIGTVSSDLGANWGPFSGGQRLKHFCDSSDDDPDRPGLAAGPTSQPATQGSVYPLYLYYNSNLANIIVFASSTDVSGFSTATRAALHTGLASGHNVIGAEGVVDDDGYLHIVWTHNESDVADVSPTHIRYRRGRYDFQSEEWSWTPALNQAPESLTGSSFPGWSGASTGPTGFKPRSFPSIAMDRVSPVSPYAGWVYVVWEERVPTSGTEHNATRVRFARRCPATGAWSSAVTIHEPPSQYFQSHQLMPEVRVDGRGNIGVCWYDTRYDNSSTSGVEYDIFFAYSTNGGAAWATRRISGATSGIDPGPPAAFDPNLTDVSIADYSGLAASPVPGTSTFYLLVMGTPRAGANSQEIYSYVVSPRAKGDYDGDFDIDGCDAVFIDECALAPTEYLTCDCTVLDFDDDGDIDIDDVGEFDLAFTDALEDCHHAPCQTDGWCGGPLMGGFGPTREPPGERRRGCELAFSFIRYTPAATCAALAERFAAWAAQNPAHARVAETLEFAACLASFVR